MMKSKLFYTYTGIVSQTQTCDTGMWWGLFDILSGFLIEQLGDARHGHTVLTDKSPLTPAHNQAGIAVGAQTGELENRDEL